MVGSIDPGNWATDYAAGQQFGYELLWVIVASTLMLLFVQHLAARLGIVSGKSLAQLVRERCPRPLTWLLGGSIVVACSATALAEYLGAALGLQILFGVPLLAGTALTAALVALLLLTQRYGRLERIVLVSVALVAAVYAGQLWLVPPSGAALAGMWPAVHGSQLFLILGILGATVMPHNVYLHSALVQSRNWSEAPHPERTELCDTSAGMLLGGVLNAAMLLVAAAAFAGGSAALDLPATAGALAGAHPAVGVLFGAGLLLAGVASAATSSFSEASIIGALFGGDALERRPAFRWGLLLAIVPVLLLVGRGFNALDLLVWSQVVLALQLPLTLAPLIWFSRDRALLGRRRLGGRWTGLATALTLGLVAVNVLFVARQFGT